MRPLTLLSRFVSLLFAKESVLQLEVLLAPSFAVVILWSSKVAWALRGTSAPSKAWPTIFGPVASCDAVMGPSCMTLLVCRLS